MSAPRNRRGASNSRAPRDLSPRRARLSIGLAQMAAIVLAGACVYWNGLEGPLIWDDQTAIVTNQTIRELWPPWRPLIPPRETPLVARPLTNASFALNYAAHGLDVTGYHLVNLVLHLTTALLLFAIVRRTLAGLKTCATTDVRQDFSPAVAFVAALWWTIHPLTSEVINYVTQRTEALMGLFLLLTLYGAMRALEPSRRRRWSVVSVLACGAGMATKESMAVAPLLIVLYDRIFAFGSVREAIRVRKVLYLALAVTWVELGILMWLQPHSTIGFATSVSSWTYLMNQAELIPRYLRLAVWPDALVLDYGLPRALSLREVAPEGAFVLALVAGAIVALVRWPAVGFLCAAFFITLAPASSVIPIASEVGAERRMYMPLAALSVLMTLAGWLAFMRAAAAATPGRRRKAGVAIVGLATAWLAALAVRTVARNAEYRTELSIWQTSVERYPQGRSRFSYATALGTAGQSESAVAQLREAVRDYPDARFGLGTELAVLGKVDEAIDELQIFIRQKPGDANRIPARSLQGRLLISRGRLDEAKEEFEAILKLGPSNLDAHSSLGDLLVSQRKYDEAESHYRAFLALRPEDPFVLVKLGSALASGGRLPEAIDTYQQALHIDPGLVRARLNLAELFFRLDRPEDAATQAAEALRLEPGRADAHNLLGAALAASGNLAEAIDHFRKALELEPANGEARRNLERARLLLNAGGNP